MKIHHRQRSRLALTSCLMLFCIFQYSTTRAQLNITDWQNYGQLAEQGAVCAGFAAIMETQDVISGDIGQLWSERRKYSGALIRNAGQLETGTSPTGEEIDATISIYREWIFANLVQTEEEINLNPESDSFQTGQNQIRQLLRANCRSVYEQADIAIFDRFPELSYLSTSAPNIKQRPSEQVDKQIQDLLSMNLELNRKLRLAETTIAEFKSRLGVPVTIETPTSRIDATNQIIESSSLIQNKPNPETVTAEKNSPNTIDTQSDQNVKNTPKLSTKTASRLGTQDKPDLVPQNQQAVIQQPLTNPKSVSETTSTNGSVSAEIAKSPVTEVLEERKISKDKEPQSESDRDSQFVIQLASFQDRRRAESMIMRLYEKHASLFPDTGLRIQSHTLPSGSKFFRVLSTPVNRDKAASLCEILWKDRIGCLIKTAN